MKKAKIHMSISTKAFFGWNFRQKCPFSAIFWPIWWYFGPNCTSPLSVTTLFMFFFAFRGLITNEKSRNPFLYIEKNTFFDQNSEKNEKQLAFFGCNFWIVWPLTRPRGPQTDIFCFHYLCREEIDQNDMSHAILIPSINIYIVFEQILKKKKKKKKKKKIWQRFSCHLFTLLGSLG